MENILDLLNVLANTYDENQESVNESGLPKILAPREVKQVEWGREC